MAYAYVLPTGTTVNTLNRKQPIGFKLADGIRDFSTTTLLPGHQWQADWLESRGIGFIALSNVPNGGEYSVHTDALGLPTESALCGKGTQIYETFNCSAGRYLTIKNTGSVNVEIYGLAALGTQTGCSTCSEINYISPTIETVEAAHYMLGSPSLYIST